MKTGLRLFVIFIITGIVLTFVLSWAIEFDKYRKKLVEPTEVSRSLSYLEAIVTEAYPLPSNDRVKKEFVDRAEEVKNQVSQKMLSIDVFKIVQPVLHVLNDQNLRLYTPFEPNYKILPFSATVIDRKIIVTSTATEKIPAGVEIVEIDDRNSDELIESLIVYTSGENYELKEQQIGNLIQLLPELFRNPRRPKVEVFYRPETHTITFEENGKAETVEVETVSIFSYPNLSSSHKSLPSRSAFEFDQQGDVGILKLGTFSLSGTVYNKYREFLNQTFLEMRNMGTLLIDLRGCTSSSSTVFKELFEHLVNKRTIVQRNISVVLSAYNLRTLEKYGIDYQFSTNELVNTHFVQEYMPRTPTFNGDLWILIDRYTSNAALDFVYTIMKLNKGTVLGEPTLTPINHITDVVYQYSEGMRMTYSYPTARFNEGGKDNLPLTPDYVLNLSTEDRIEYVKGNKDVMLERALMVIQKVY